MVQMWYFGKYTGVYREMKCKKCRHVYSLVAGELDHKSVTLTRQNRFRESAKTTEMEVDGTIIKGLGVMEMKSRDTSTTESHFKCTCAICGNVDTRSEERVKRGNWSEYK